LEGDHCVTNPRSMRIHAHYHSFLTAICIVSSCCQAFIINEASIRSSFPINTILLGQTSRGVFDTTEAPPLSNRNTPKRTATSNVRRNKKNHIWDNSWIPDGEEREKYKSILKKKQKENLEYFFEQQQSSSNQRNEVAKKEGLDVLTEWSKLGEGKQCQNAAEDLLSSVPSLADNLQDYEFHANVHRRVLHAYYNQLQRVTWNKKYKKPEFRLSDEELRMGREVLRTAEEVLKLLEDTLNNYGENDSPKMETLLDASDYAPLILGYYQVTMTFPALSALRRLSSLYKKNERSESLAPGCPLYLAVMKSIFNCDAREWETSMGGKLTKIKVIDVLCNECLTNTRNLPHDIRGSSFSLLQVYNVAFDAWSKVLPPPTKKRENHFFLDEGKVQQMEEVSTKVTNLWKMMLEETDVRPISKTYTSLIYSYIKSGRIEEAFSMVEPLAEYLIQRGQDCDRGTRLEYVDSRALSMLCNALMQNATKLYNKKEETDDVVGTRKMVEVAERIERIIKLLWELTEIGYTRATPTVFLYTTAISAWAETRSQEGLSRAKIMFDDLRAREKQTPWNSLLKVDIFVYNAFIKAIARQPNLLNAADKAGSIVKFLEKGEDNTIRTDIDTYNGLIQACLASPDDIEKAEQTLDHMLKTGKPRPNELTFRLIIVALLENDTPGGTARVENILDRMEENFLPKANIYERIIYSWCCEIGKASRARELLERMEELFRAGGNESLQPIRSLYNIVIRALEDQGESSDSIKEKRNEMYGRSVTNKKLRSKNQVFTLLNDIDASLAGGATPSGNTHNFNQAIAVLADSGKIWAGSRAEDILNFMLDLTFKQKNSEATPNIVTFNSVMGAWVKSGHALAGEKVSSVMKKLDDLHNMNLLEDVVADRVTYNTMMSAYAKSTDVNFSGEKAQACFDKLVELHEATGDAKYKPDVISFSTILNAWAQSIERGAAQKAESFLIKMVTEYTMDPECNPRPDTSCFNQVLYAWARSDEVTATERAESILMLMQDGNKANNLCVIPSTQTYNIVLLAISNCPGKESLSRVLELLKEMNKLPSGFGKPNAVSYNTVISAFTKQGDINDAVKILDELLTRDEVKLDTRFFSSLIYSLSETESFDAPIVAERVVNDLLRRPNYSVDTQICNALINCWGRANKSEGPLHAMDILEEMLDGKYGSSTQPDVVTFTSVIDIWAKSGVENAGTIAEEVLDLLKNTAGVIPNAQTYTATIHAFARSNSNDKARKAQKMLQRMKVDYSRGNRDAEPSIYTYNAVLNAAEFTFGDKENRKEAFKIACETFHEIQSTMKPDHISYASFMGVIAQLMPDGDIRNDMVRLLFRRCCVDGQLAPVMMKKFREATSTQQYHNLMGSFSEEKLPEDWTRNAKRIK